MLLFAFLLFVAFYVVFGYPLLLAYLSRREQVVEKRPILKSVTVIIPVFNGAGFIKEKLNSILALDYPQSLLEIIVVSDGSTDSTNEYVSRLAPLGIKLITVPRGGKPAALNAAIPEATGEILVLTDVRQELAHDCVRKLVNCFADPKVGVASGHLIIRQGKTHSESDVGLYWRYETWIRDHLSRMDSIFGATGPIYAIRKDLARPLPEDILLDDMALPLGAFFQGFRSIVEPAAKAYDVPTCRSVEFHRKVRTLAGNWQLLTHFPQLLGLSNRMWLHYVSYKLGRLLMPFVMIGIAASSLTLPDGIRVPVLLAQAAFYALALIDPYFSRTFPLKRITSLSRTFNTMMLATLIAPRVFFVDPRSLWKVTNVALDASRALERPLARSAADSGD